MATRLNNGSLIVKRGALIDKLLSGNQNIVQEVKPKRRRREEEIQLAVCQFIKYQYPDVFFTSESSGIKLTKGQACKATALRSGKKLPDLWITEARGGKFGLFIELKAENPFKVNGQPKTKHIEEQLEVIERLNNKGYLAKMIVGTDDAIALIRSYLKGKPTISLNAAQ